MQPNTLLTQPAFRTAGPAAKAMLAAAGLAAVQAQQIVATFRTTHGVDDCDMPALAAVQRRPAREWTEEQRIACDLTVNAMKADGRYDARRAGVRA